MSRKVFISVLGAGFYGESVYGKDKDEKYRGGEDFRSSKTRFIQQATLEYLKANEWNESDAAYILVTERAKETNWNKTITTRKNPKTEKEEPYTGLEKIIEDMHLPFETKAVDIADGKNEKEIWDIFDSIISDEKGFIREGDELYFDLTHGFRYLPMLVLVLGNYAKFLKKTEKCSITYGNFDMRENGVAPIIDLLPLSALQDWTFAVADYLENGYAGLLQQLGNDMLTPILRDRNKISEEEMQDVQNLKGLVDNINTMALERQTCRGISVMGSKSVKSIREKIDRIQKSVISAFTPLIREIDDSLIGFDSVTNVFNTFAAAKWCYHNHQYQAATTFIEEGVITIFCLRHNIDYKNEYARELVTTAFNVKKPRKAIPIEKVSLKKDEFLPLFQSLLDDPLLEDIDLVNWFVEFCDLRNDYNHCGFRSINRTPLKVSKMLTKIEDAFIIVKEKLLPLQLPPIEIIKKPLLFLNLSNHPISDWSEEQLNDAKLFGEIQEMPFPTINPNATQKDIEDLVDEYVKQFAELSSNSNLTVHVMGEMTFTYNLVSRLKALGIRCVASTTERRTHLDPDGNKVSEFHFVQFREY